MRLKPPRPTPEGAKLLSGSRKTSMPKVPAIPYSSVSLLSVMEAANPLSSTAPLVTPTVNETVSLILKSLVNETPKPVTLTVGFTRVTGPNLITVGRFGSASSNSYPSESKPPTAPVLRSGIAGASALEKLVGAVCLPGSRSKLVTAKRSNWKPSGPP